MSLSSSQSFLDTFEKMSPSLDREKLLDLLSALVRLLPQDRRGESILLLRNIAGNAPVNPEPLPAAEMQRVLDAIEDLHLDIQSRMEAIENGSFEDLDDFDDYDYYEEDPDLVSDEQLTSLAGLFAEAGFAFARNDKPAAEKMYQALFDLVDEVEEVGILPTDDIDLRRERARYARCVYDSSATEKRPQAVLSAMGLEDRSRYSTHQLPLLEEVKTCDTAPLPGWDVFLPAWQEELGKMDFHLKRVAALLLEATAMKSDIGAVAELAGRWGAEQPLGYLFLLEKLTGDSDWPGLGGYAREALDALPEGRERARVADSLVTAGQKLGLDNIILTGYREGLRSLPTDATLAALVAEAARQNRRAEELAKIQAILSEKKEKYGVVELRVKALLMAGKIDEAFALCPTDKVVGWSSDTTGLIFAAVLHLLSGGNPECTLSEELLRDHTDRIPPLHWDTVQEKTDTAATLLAEIKAGLNAIDQASFAADRYRRWADDLGARRVARILENQHRSAYGRAAQVLGGLAEALAAGDKIGKAQNMIREYCRILFPRHTAFHREIKAAIGRSKILAGRISLL